MGTGDKAEMGLRTDVEGGMSEHIPNPPISGEELL